MGTCSKHMDPYKISPKVILNIPNICLNLGHFGVPLPEGWSPLQNQDHPTYIFFCMSSIVIFPIYTWGKGMIL